jgi:membrane-associated protein
MVLCGGADVVGTQMQVVVGQHETVIAAQPGSFLAFGPSWMDPDVLIDTFGTLGILAIVFVESALLAGFFLPGDSLLFTAGVLSATGTLPPLWVFLLTVPLAAIAGDQVGYMIGAKAGPGVFSRPRSRLFRPEHVVRAEQFFARHGARTIVLARFVPIVRTIAPVMAGVAGMPHRTFTAYNVVGACGWGIGVTLLGYALGHVHVVRANIEFFLIGIVLLSNVPIAVQVVRSRRRGARARARRSADPPSS